MAFRSKKQPVQNDKSGQSEFIRRIKANPFVFTGTIVILVIVVVAFVLVPALPNMGTGGGTDLSFGSYNKIPIAFVPGNYFSQVYQELAKNQRTDDISAQLRIWRDAFEQTVAHTGILEEMKEARYTPPAETVDMRVAQLPMFQENGRFSAARYDRLDGSTRLSLWRQMQEDMTEQLYRSDIRSLGTPAAEASFVASMISPRRSFDMTVFSVDDYPDSEVLSYAEANPSLFRITHFSRISISSERDARQILAQIRDGVITFEDAARNNSKDSYAEQGGDMGVKMVWELAAEVPGMEESLVNLTKGEMSGVTALSSDWVFFRAEEDPLAANMEDPANREKFRSYLLQNERGRMEDWAIARADEFIASLEGGSADAGDSFIDALVEQGLPRRHFGPLPINYGDVELFTSLSSFGVTELAGGASNENFWQTAFSTPLNTPSRPIVLGGNVLVLFPLEEIPGDDQTREGIESAYTTYWMSIVTDRSIHGFFLNNGKLEDRFIESYINLFRFGN